MEQSGFEPSTSTSPFHRKIAREFGGLFCLMIKAAELERESSPCIRLDIGDRSTSDGPRIIATDSIRGFS